jgi:hypothetical protein
MNVFFIDHRYHGRDSKWYASAVNGFVYQKLTTHGLAIFSSVLTLSPFIVSFILHIFSIDNDCVYIKRRSLQMGEFPTRAPFIDESDVPSDISSFGPSNFASDVPSFVPVPETDSPSPDPVTDLSIPLPPSFGVRRKESNGLPRGTMIAIIVVAVYGFLWVMFALWKLGEKRPESRIEVNEHRTDTLEAPPSATTTEQQPVVNEPIGPPILLDTQQPVVPPPRTVTAHRIVDPAGHVHESIDVAVDNYQRRGVVDPPAPIHDYVVTYKDQSRSVVATMGVDPPAPLDDCFVTYKDQSRSVTAPTPVASALTRIPNDSNDAHLLPIVTAVPYHTEPPPSQT